MVKTVGISTVQDSVQFPARDSLHFSKKASFEFSGQKLAFVEIIVSQNLQTSRNHINSSKVNCSKMKAQISCGSLSAIFPFVRTLSFFFPPKNAKIWFKEQLLALEPNKHKMSEKEKAAATKSLVNAVEKGDLAAAKKALQNGADASYEDKSKGQTLLQAAIQSKNYSFEIIEELVKNGAKVNEVSASSSWLGASGEVLKNSA